MKPKVVGCRITNELYNEICKLGIPSDIMREALELYLNLNKNPRKHSVNTICFNCKHQTLCELIERHLDAKMGGEQ